MTGAIPIKVEVLNHSEYLVSMPVSRTGTIKIETEPLQRKTFTIGVMTTGMLEDGYQTGKVTLSPETLTVEGPESLIGQISSVGIEINLDGKNADWSDSEEPKFYDANKNSITISDRLISNCKSVDYTMEILKVKNLSLDFDVTGEVAGGYRYTGVECGLKSVPVVGLKSALASLNTITIPKEELDVSGARANIVKTIDLNDYLPEGVSLAGKGQFRDHGDTYGGAVEGTGIYGPHQRCQLCWGGQLLQLSGRPGNGHSPDPCASGRT